MLTLWLSLFPRQTYFEDNPRDLQLLRHDLPLHPAVVKPHLGHVPDYLGECGLTGQEVAGWGSALISPLLDQPLCLVLGMLRQNRTWRRWQHTGM